LHFEKKSIILNTTKQCEEMNKGVPRGLECPFLHTGVQRKYVSKLTPARRGEQGKPTQLDYRHLRRELSKSIVKNKQIKSQGDYDCEKERM